MHIPTRGMSTVSIHVFYFSSLVIYSSDPTCQSYLWSVSLSGHAGPLLFARSLELRTVFKSKMTARRLTVNLLSRLACEARSSLFVSLNSSQLTTNGSNFRGLWQFSSSTEESILDDDNIYSNDIYAILKTYGVEMAREAILREIGGVFGAYNIDVDRRHLELIADYMVRYFACFTRSATT